MCRRDAVFLVLRASVFRCRPTGTQILPVPLSPPPTTAGPSDINAPLRLNIIQDSPIHSTNPLDPTDSLSSPETDPFQSQTLLSPRNPQKFNKFTMPSAAFDTAANESKQLTAKPSNDELLEVRHDTFVLPHNQAIA
jgi:hypothetical protein